MTIPAHKQYNPAIAPGQTLTPIPMSTEFPPLPGHGFKEQTLADYIANKRRQDAFDVVAKEESLAKKKLTFAQWYPLNKNKIGFNYEEARLVWEAAQENM